MQVPALFYWQTAVQPVYRLERESEVLGCSSQRSLLHAAKDTCHPFSPSANPNPDSIVKFLANRTHVHVPYMLSPVRLSSVTLVHLTQPVEIFGNISAAFATLAIP